jgi:RimJ/RimL family protein N-acetyltransferase
MRSLNPWVAPPRPARVVLEGQWCRLEPFDPDRHGDSLFEASMAPGAEERFRWLFEVPRPRSEFDEWLLRSSASDDPLFLAVVDAATGRAEGRQALMRITPEHGVVEIGHVLWGPRMARTRIATEALFLAARHVFDDLGYRRFEWKCNSRNEPSRRAALRFGFQFEGIFRQHMVQKGENRDTAWFAIIDADWPRLRAGYERWLAPDNFDASGQQRLTLAAALSQR